MTPAEIFKLLGGVGLFLFGMTIMSSGLKNAAGEQMRVILEKDVYKRQLHDGETDIDGVAVENTGKGGGNDAFDAAGLDSQRCVLSG